MATTLTVAGLKGGVGKSLIALATAEAVATTVGSALVLDCDPQGTLMRWSDEAARDGRGALSSNVVSLPTSDLRRRIPGIANGYELVVLDTAPGHVGIASAAMGEADAVVIPISPSLTDLDRLRTTLDLVEQRAARSLVVLNRARAGTRSLEEVREVLSSTGVRLARTVIPQREAYARAFGKRLPSELVSYGSSVLGELLDLLEEGESQSA